ncbi:CGNR zinc finger domain-containing protein [Kineosporia succinea]|uniref:RNA-binding Zn ribbon-like protein n=1 Tax=Kineosporia succinea TaxID=84632 RepID=A0ABT9PBF4_9ACTN|nr:CGNR zinc finger domain-containing protein [Kineosporia succinea]MDP9829724.1 putative RNA-binding Zn ribbon-like protein [Kineosporia succinea]
MTDLGLVEEFVNTLDLRSFSRHGHDHVSTDDLTSAQALSAWFAAHDLPATTSPTALGTALSLRESLRTALGDGTPSPLTEFPLHLTPGPTGALRLTAATGVPALDTIVETVAVSVAAGTWRRLKLCASDDCRWAFHDTSRSGGGRWCSMEVCGNRHKTRAYRQRRGD